MERYALNPAVSFLAVSPNEVTAQGSPLDGFVLTLRDETRRGLARAVTDALRTPLTLDDLHDLVSNTGVELQELGEYIKTLVSSGAVLRFDHAHGRDDDVLAFKRFGTVAVPETVNELVFVGGALAEMLSSRMRDFGLSANAMAATELSPLEKYQAAERRDEDDPAALGPSPRLIVVPDVLGVAELQGFNRRAVTAGAPVFYLSASGVQFVVGPYVDPGSTACWWEYERLHARSLEHYSHYAAHASANGAASGAVTPPVTVDALAAAATPFLVELALTGTSELAGQVIRGRSTTAETSRHSIMRLPRCPVCMTTRPPIRNPLY